MATETDIYPVGPTIDNANRLRATQGLPAIGAADEPLTPEQQSLGAPQQPDEQKQAELEGQVNGWIKSHDDLLLNEQFNQIKDKTAQKAVVDDLSANIESEVDALHDKGIPSFAITNIRSALDEQRKRSHAMIDAGDRPLTPQQINDELDKRHADLRDLPTGGKKEHAQAVYQAVSAALHSDKFTKQRGYIAKHMGLRDAFTNKTGVILGSATEIEDELHKMAGDSLTPEEKKQYNVHDDGHWAITNIVDSGLRSAISLAAGVAGRRAQDMLVNLTTANYDPKDPSEVATIAAYRDFEQELKQRNNPKADMTGQFAGMLVGGGAVFNSVKGVTTAARGARLVSRAAQALNMTQKTWKTTGSLLTLGISAANLASSKHGTTFNPMEKGYLKDFALESVKLAMLHAVGAGTARLFSRSIVRAMAPTLQFNKWVGTGFGMSAAGATNWAGMRGMEVMEAAFGDSHKSFTDQLRDDWLGQMDYETLKRKGMPIGKWGGEAGLGAGAGGFGAWKGARSYADVMEAYRAARARVDARYHSGEFGFDAHNYVTSLIDDAYTKRMKPEQREAFLDDAERYRKIWNDAKGAVRDITDATEAYKTAESLRNSDSPLAATQADNSGDTSALIAQQKLMTALAKQKAKKKAAMEEKMLRGETPTEETKPSEPTTPAPHPIIAQIDSAVAAHASELSALGHPAELVLVTIPDESGGGGFQFNQKTGKIEYDPVRIEKVTIGMTPKQLAKYIRRGIAEEIIHVATDKYASESPENQAKLHAILEDAEAVAAAEKAYGKNAFEKLNETQKAFEVARVLIQGPRALTEAAYRFFKDLLRWLSQKVKNLSPETKELLDGIKSKMEARESGKVEEAKTTRVSDDEMSKRRTPLPQKDRRSLQDRAEEAVTRLAGPERAHAERRLESIARDHNQIRREYADAKTVGEKLRLEMEMVEVENRWRKITGETEIEINHAVTADDIKKDAERLYYREQEIKAKLKSGEAITPQDRQDWKIAGMNPEELPKETKPVESPAKPALKPVEHTQANEGPQTERAAYGRTGDVYDAFGNVQRKAGEPKNEKAQSVPSVQKADEPVRLPQKEVAPAAPSPEPVTPAAASHAQTAREWESANKRKLPQNRAPIPESLSLPVGTVVRAKNYGGEGDIVITGPLQVNTNGIIEYPANFTGSGREAAVEAGQITEIKPAAAKPVEAERSLAPLTEAERSLAESLAKKYGMPVLPTAQAEGEIENLSRFSNMLERAADKSKDETELAQILSAAKGRIDESRIANAVANNPHSSEATFSEAKANSERQKMAGDESIAYLDARRAELRKQRGLDAQPAAPAAEQPAPAPIEQAIADANWRGTVREVPAPRSMGGEGVKLYIPVDASGKDVSVGGQTILGKTPAEAIELAQKNAKPAPAPAVGAKTRLDLMLDGVERTGKELTIEVTDANRDNLTKIIETAEKRGLRASTDGRFVLIRPAESQSKAATETIFFGGRSGIDEITGQPNGQHFTTDSKTASNYARMRGQGTSGSVYKAEIPKDKIQYLGENNPQAWLVEVDPKNPADVQKYGIVDFDSSGRLFAFTKNAPKRSDGIAGVGIPKEYFKETALDAKASPAPASAAPLLPKPIIKALLRSGHEVVPAGSQQAGFRSLVMEKIGKKVPQSKAGLTAVTKALAEYLGVDTNDTAAGVEAKMREKLTDMLAAHEAQAAPAEAQAKPVVAATPQAEGGIFGYAWADIRSKQQGGKLAALIRGNAPKATESDFAVLEKHGMDWLYDNEKGGIIDRLGLPAEKPSKKAAVKPAAIPKIIDVTETPGAQVSGPRLAIKLDDGTIIHSADAGIHAVLAARAGIDPSRIVDTGFYGVLSGEFKGGKTTTAPTKSTLAPAPVSESASVRAKIVKGATVEVALVRGSKLTHRAKVQDVDTQNGVVTVTFKKGKKFNGGETQTVRLDQVAPLKSVRTRMLNEAQFEGMTEDQKRQTKADAKEFDNLVADHPEMNWYNWRVNDLAGTKSGDMDIAAERKRASEEAMKEIGGDRPGLHPDNSIMKAELLPKLKAMIEEKAHELAREIPEDALSGDTDFLPPSETPEPVAPKLRPSDGKGTGELLQGNAAPFNLVAETAADIAKREAREAAEQVAKDAKDAAEAKVKQDKEQGNLFGVATPRMGQELADKADALGIPLKTEQIKKLIADDPDTLREVRARIDRETGGDQAGMVRTANPLENRDERSAPFYSALTKTVQGLPQETMTVQQARAAIEKGAKKDEIAMSGILTDPLSPLAGKQPGDKVTKAELTGYALERQATVQEVVLGGGEAEMAAKAKESAWRTFRREQAFANELSGRVTNGAIAHGYTQLEAANLTSKLDDGRVTVEELPKELRADASGYLAQLEKFLQAKFELENVQDAPGSPTHFSQYQLPGADEGSYREMFVTWPGGNPSPMQSLRYKELKAKGAESGVQNLTPDEIREWMELRSRTGWNDGHSQYSDIANPIVRIRRNIRTDAEGRKTYFIEEMQGPGKGEQEKMPPELRKRIYEIGMKRALRDAVDEGADAIAWTTGEQQAERYDLSKQVDEVSVSRGGALGKWEVWATKDGRQVVSKTVETLQEVDGLIGKELAEKVSDMKAGDFQRRFSGVDLKVGGEGLKHTYDVRLPNLKFIQDLEKKFGVKVGTAEIGTGKAFKDVDARAEEIWQEWENAGTTYGKDFADAQEQAQQEAGDRPSKTGLDTVHSLPIPDALKTQQRGGNTIFTANPADSLRETSTKNAVVDEERAKLGLDPIMSEIRQSHPVVWDAAMRALERDPMAGRDLVNEINGRPRALTATEEAIILRHKINTQTAFYREMEVANDGNASPQDRMSAKLYAAQHLDALNEIDNATRKSGAEWGKLGAFRQRLAREDYTLVAMLRNRVMATGERIEPGGAEYQFVEKLNKRIAELEAKVAQDARNHAAKLEQLRETAMEDAMQKMRSDGTPAQKKEREILARIAANMESAKENADAALREMGFGPVANAAGPSGNIIGTANPQDANTLDPKVLKLLSVGGANHLRKLGNDRAKWDEAMLSNYGPKVQPHLDAVWDVSQATLNDFIDGQAPKETRENTKKKILTDAEKQKRILDSIHRKSATPDKVAPYLKQLAKQLVSQGVNDRWTLLTMMETMLKDILLDATRSEIRNSLADYGEGKYRKLSTDEASVRMRQIRAQLQQEAKIEDMMKRGELPWKIGVERGEPDAETRTMIKEVNEIKKELGLEATSEDQAKSARAAIKTRLRNEIEELEKFIKTRERIPSNRRSVEDDAETAQLRRDVRELRAKYQEVVGVDTMAEEAAKKSALEKSIADLQNQIVTGEIEQAAKQQTVDTPEIAALKAQKAALLEQRKALRSPSTEDIERKKEQALLDRITKLSAQIATGVADTKVGKPTVESANVSAYRDIIKDLNKQLAEIRNPKKSPEQTKLDELDKRIAEVSAKIARGDLSAKQGKPTVDTAEQAVRKDTLRALNKQLADMRKAAKPTLTPDEIALKTWKTRAEKRLIDLKDRTARGDFSKKVRKVMPMDAAALKTKAELEAVKLEFAQANYKAMTANAPWWVKTMDVAQKYRRWAVLTSATVFEKLAMAGVWRTFVLQPLEDAAGGIARHLPLFKQIAPMAPRHGQGFNTRIQLDGLIKGFASGASEAAAHLKKTGNLLTGSKALSWLFGEMDEAKRLTQTPMEMLSGKRKVEPDTAWEIPGVLHAVVKDIPKMVEFHKSVAFRTKWYADRGVDVSDPLMQEKIQIESFQDAMRAIFMQDNAVLNKLNRFIRSLGEPDAKTGKVSKWGKVLQTAWKAEFPIVKIPTNIVAEAFEYVAGIPASWINARRAIKDGITNLQPEHADMIMRQLKKGLVGPAIFLTGFLLAANIGGYFQHGKKRDPEDVPAGSIRVGDTTVHERALHAPALLIFQAGATVARVMNSRMRKSDVDEQGMGVGLVAAALGLADEIPFVKEAFNLSALRNPYQKSHWFGEKARSITEPALMQWIAKLRDTDASGNPIKRKTDGFADEMKIGIPGLRETLDVKQEKVPHARRRY